MVWSEHGRKQGRVAEGCSGWGRTGRCPPISIRGDLHGLVRRGHARGLLRHLDGRRLGVWLGRRVPFDCGHDENEVGEIINSHHTRCHVSAIGLAGGRARLQSSPPRDLSSSLLDSFTSDIMRIARRIRMPCRSRFRRRFCAENTWPPRRAENRERKVKAAATARRKARRSGPVRPVVGRLGGRGSAAAYAPLLAPR